MMEDFKGKITQFVEDNTGSVIAGTVFTGCMISALCGYKAGALSKVNGVEVTKLVYNKTGDLCDKYIIKQIQIK